MISFASLGAIFLLVLSSTVALAQTGDGGHRIAVLSPAAASWPPIRDALAARGLVDGRNLLSDIRTGTPDQLPELARELIASRPDVIIAVSSALGAVKGATDVVPIVSFGPDPVEQGFAESQSRPGGNVTGVAIFAAQLDGKRLEVLAEATPGQLVAVLLNPVAQSAIQSRNAVEAAAKKLDRQPSLFEARGPEDYPAAFAAMRTAGMRSVVISANAWFFRDGELIGRLARDASIATMCEWGDMAANICTMAYGPERSHLNERVADLVARILRGSEPREIPIEQPSRFEFVINLKAAKALGLTIPPTLLARADEVIE